MRIHVLSLILSFCIGISIMLCLVPKPTVVVKFPRPDNADDEYRAADGTCFKITPKRVDCDKDSERVLPQPVADAKPSGDHGLTFHNPFGGGRP